MSKALHPNAPARRTFGLAAVVLVAAAIVMVLLQPGGAAAQPRGGGPAYEYGELRLLGADAVFIINDRAWFMEGPERRSQIETQGEANLRVIPPLDVFHLNTLGEAGWEIVPVPRAADTGGRAYLMRRPI